MGLYPYQKNKGQSIQAATNVPVSSAYLIKYSVSPAALDTDGVKAAVTLGETAQSLKAGITQPAVARVLSVTADATGAGDVVITGKDLAGNAITETIAAVATTTVAGTKAFAKVTGIAYPIGTGTIAVGFTDAIGLPSLLEYNTIQAVYVDGVADTKALTVTVSTTELCKNTVTRTDALDGKKVDYYFFD